MSLTAFRRLKLIYLSSIVYLLALSIVGCDNAEVDSIALYSETFNQLRENNSPLTTYIGLDKETRRGVYSPREKFVVSKKALTLSLDSVERKFELDGCRNISTWPIDLNPASFERMLGDVEVLIVDADTIVSYGKYMEEMEVDGYSGIIELYHPLSFQCDNDSFVVTAIRKDVIVASLYKILLRILRSFSRLWMGGNV